jgi:hypothetical protein
MTSRTTALPVPSIRVPARIAVTLSVGAAVCGCAKSVPATSVPASGDVALSARNIEAAARMGRIISVPVVGGIWKCPAW